MWETWVWSLGWEDPLIPGLGRSSGEGNSCPLQYSGLENSMNCIVCGVSILSIFPDWNPSASMDIDWLSFLLMVHFCILKKGFRIGLVLSLLFLSLFVKSYQSHNFSNDSYQVVLVVKNQLADVGDIREMDSILGWGWAPGEGHGNPLQYSCLDNPMDIGLQSIWSQRVRHGWNNLACVQIPKRFV